MGLFDWNAWSVSLSLRIWILIRVVLNCSFLFSRVVVIVTMRVLPVRLSFFDDLLVC